jgi:hypothetical protein
MLFGNFFQRSKGSNIKIPAGLFHNLLLQAEKKVYGKKQTLPV